MPYQQLTKEERVSITTLGVAGFSIRCVARPLNRSTATISRELGRNPNPDPVAIYNYTLANQLASKRRKLTKTNPK